MAGVAPMSVASPIDAEYAPLFREERLERSAEDALRDENNALRAQIELLRKDLEDKKLQISNLKEEMEALGNTDDN